MIDPRDAAILETAQAEISRLYAIARVVEASKETILVLTEVLFLLSLATRDEGTTKAAARALEALGFLEEKEEEGTIQ